MANPNKGAKGVAASLNLPREEKATPFTDWLMAEVKAGRTPDGLDDAVEQYMKICAEKGE